MDNVFFGGGVPLVKKNKRWCRKIEIMMEKSEKSPARGVFDEVPATRREQREPFCIHQKSKLIKTKDATILFCLCPRAAGGKRLSCCVRLRENDVQRKGFFTLPPTKKRCKMLQMDDGAAIAAPTIGPHSGYCTRTFFPPMM